MKTLIGVAVGVLAGTTATAVAAESWHNVARTQARAYLADVDSITNENGVATLRMAMVPRTGDAADQSHSIEVYQFQCTDSRWRTAGLTDFGPDGSAADEFPEPDAEWTAIRAGTQPEFLKQMACEGYRARPPFFETIKAYIDAGRP